MNGFQSGNYASNAVKSASCGHCVYVGADNHFAGWLCVAGGLAGADQIPASINFAFKANIFKL